MFILFYPAFLGVLPQEDFWLSCPKYARNTGTSNCFTVRFYLFFPLINEPLQSNEPLPCLCYFKSQP